MEIQEYLLQFKLSRKNLEDASKALGYEFSRHPSRGQRLAVLALSRCLYLIRFLGGVGFGALIWSATDWDSPESLVGLCVCGVLGMWVLEILRKRIFQRIHVDNLLGIAISTVPQSVALSEDGVHYQNEFLDWKVKWAAVEEITATKDTIVLSMATFRLPISADAFEDKNERETVLNQIVSWKKAAQ